MFKRTIATVAAFVLIAGSSLAQMTSKTPLLDSRGKPLPFGVPAYHMPNVPLGTGPYKAIMSEEQGLSAHVAYYPGDISKLGNKKMPIIVWANGSCLYAGNRYRQYLTEIASHGYLVISGGPIGPKELEVGPQENPAVRRPGSAATGTPTTAPANPGATPAEPRVTVAMLKEAIDWAIKQNGDPTSRFNARLDTTDIVVMGHSCGGGLAIQTATQDSRVSALGVWHSGLGLARGSDPSVLDKLRLPVLLISGTEDLDSAYTNAKSTFERINNSPVFYGWRDDLEHIGTFGAANGGELGLITVKWLEWQTRGNTEAARLFKGAACSLCKDPAWHIQKKRIDGTTRSNH